MENQDPINAGQEETGHHGQNITRVPATYYPYSTGLYGGVLAGLAMIPVALVYGMVSGHGIWYPVNIIAATLIRSWQQASVAQLEQFSVAGLFVGLAVHMLISILLGFTFGLMLPAFPGSPILWAFIASPVMWAGATFAALPLINPVMAQYINWPSFAIANIVYSLVIGVYIARAEKVPAY